MLFCGCCLGSLKRGTSILQPCELILICPFFTLHQYAAHIHKSIYWNLINNCSGIDDDEPEGTDEFSQADLHNIFYRTLVHSADFFLFIGNKLTLETRPCKDGIDIRQELLKFHSTYYSSNLMGLCVLGRGKKCHVWMLQRPQKNSRGMTSLCTVYYSRQERGTKAASHWRSWWTLPIDVSHDISRFICKGLYSISLSNQMRYCTLV